jgi:hypothetical protein
VVVGGSVGGSVVGLLVKKEGKVEKKQDIDIDIGSFLEENAPGKASRAVKYRVQNNLLNPTISTASDFGSCKSEGRSLQYSIQCDPPLNTHKESS